VNISKSSLFLVLLLVFSGINCVCFLSGKENEEKILSNISLLEDKRILNNKLINYLNHPSSTVRARTAKALGRITDQFNLKRDLNKAQKVASELNKAYLKEKDENVKAEILFALGQIGLKEGKPALTEGIKEKSANLRALSCEAMGKVKDPESVLPLIKASKDSSPEVRGEVAIALGKLGITNKDFGKPSKELATLLIMKAPTVLTKLIQDESPQVRWRAWWSIFRTYPVIASTFFSRAFKDEDYRVRVLAISTLEEFSAFPEDKVKPLKIKYKKTLEQLLRDPNWQVQLAAQGAFQMLYKERKEIKLNYPPIPRVDIQKLLTTTKNPVVEIETEKGNIYIELFPLEAPLTVKHFLKLIKEGFYDGICWHRVIPGFVIQGGDPTGTGSGNSGEPIRCEINTIKHSRGVLSMAHAGRDTGDSQFFITHFPQPHLDGLHTVFGRVIAGMEVVDQIKAGDLIKKIKILKE